MASTPPVFAGKLHLRMTHTKVPGESVGATERLVVGAEVTTHLLLPCIVYCVFMTGEVVRSREDGVARFPGARIDAVALVRPSLAV